MVGSPIRECIGLIPVCRYYPVTVLEVTVLEVTELEVTNANVRH